jgi:Protein of unknown function, DUF547
MLREILLRCQALLVISVAISACSKTEKEKEKGAPPPAPTPAATSSAATGDSCSPEAYDALLKKYVDGGKIDYARFKANKADLEAFDAYLARIATCDVAKLPALAQEAFWVNAYNTYNIKGVLEKYPIENIKTIDGFLDKRLWRVANRDLTINDMEYKHVIPARMDARQHFTVVCADLGSVPLLSDAYTSSNLEAGLESQTKKFVADSRNFNVDIPKKIVNVSMLFSPKWYEKDFLADKRFKGKKAVEYLIPYVDKATADFLASGDYTVNYIEWDWTLNATAAK